MIKFPSIEQFRTVIRQVRTQAQYAGKDENGDPIIDLSLPIPTLKFRGTIKLHGTNAGVVYDVATDSFTYQSRERVLSLTQDNAGFMLAQMKNELYFRDFVAQVTNEILPGRDIAKVALFGEWCGKGIQKGVAISELPRMFVIFACKVVFGDGTDRWIPIDEIDMIYPKDIQDAVRIYNIDFFPSFTIDIDFNHPELAQNKMIEITNEVEQCCPVGADFGVKGIGEGVVWTCITPGWEGSRTWFKVKGEKHSVSKVKTLAAVS